MSYSKMSTVLTTPQRNRLASKELEDFLRQQCKDRGLSLRGLSVAAGLSPGTVHNIITRNYQPSIFSLNQLADYLRVKRQYLWQLAGLLPDMDYGQDTTFSDPRLRFQFAQADKLPEAARELIVAVVQDMIDHFQAPQTPTEAMQNE